MRAPMKSKAAQTTSRKWGSSTTCFNPSEQRISVLASTNSHPPKWTRASSTPVSQEENMNGSFRSDITRDTFNRLNNFSRVLKQQGRVDLDAEWNEQVDILLYYLRTLTKDLVGQRAAVGLDPHRGGFLVTATAYKPGKCVQTVHTTLQTESRKRAVD